MTSHPFPAGARDPLLVIAKVIAIFVMVMMGIAAGALLIGCVALSFNQADALVELAKEGYTGAPGPVIWGAVAAMLLALIPIGLIFWFLKELVRLIDSVGTDPFMPENGTRLSRMGWLVLAIQVAAIPLGAVVLWLSERVKSVDADVDIGFSGNGLILALVLFILARVFRHGAAMREELEGTV